MIIDADGFLLVGSEQIDVRFMPSGNLMCWRHISTGSLCVEISMSQEAERERIGFEYIGEILHTYNEKHHLSWAKEQKHLEVIFKSNIAQNKLFDRYSQLEVLSWKDQEAEALSLMVDINAEAPLLRALSEARGITIESLRDKVIQNINNFKNATQQILSQQQKYEDNIKAAQSISDLDCINAAF